MNGIRSIIDNDVEIKWNNINFFDFQFYNLSILLLLILYHTRLIITSLDLYPLFI